MNFSIHLDEKTAKALELAAKRIGRPRNAIIREAISCWLVAGAAGEWPTEFQKFRGISTVPRFEAHRAELSDPREDVFR